MPVYTKCVAVQVLQHFNIVGLIIFVMHFKVGHHGLFRFAGHRPSVVWVFQRLGVLLIYIVKLVG
jgi:hypothetical protein